MSAEACYLAVESKAGSVRRRWRGRRSRRNRKMSTRDAQWYNNTFARAFSMQSDNKKYIQSQASEWLVFARPFSEDRNKNRCSVASCFSLRPFPLYLHPFQSHFFPKQAVYVFLQVIWIVLAVNKRLCSFARSNIQIKRLVNTAESKRMSSVVTVPFAAQSFRSFSSVSFDLFDPIIIVPFESIKSSTRCGSWMENMFRAKASTISNFRFHQTAYVNALV